jgi:hypothetical protein
MTNAMAWIEMYHAQILTGSFFALQGILLAVLLVVAQRVRAVKRQIQSISEQVQQYMKVVLDAESPQESEKQMEADAGKNFAEEESRLISAVLREIFP